LLRTKTNERFLLVKNSLPPNNFSARLIIYFQVVRQLAPPNFAAV
jgi:hypothetical protein